ncbi:hypothetical protein [Canibacter zhoujuaniae]|uniref:hypothetical protein n=1 Tax=Canibacter zhoujuaniae TaxID=2708343 RepID=UPI00141E75E5|nr:hypothetical protein [Canibacter zhoujuaniae]
MRESQQHAIVIGDNPAAFAAALELAEVGVAVTLQLGAQSLWPYAPVHDSDDALATLLARPGELSRDLEIAVTRVPVGPLYFGRNTATAKQLVGPRIGGITGNPLASQNRSLLGGGGSFRAYLDRLLPVLTIGKYKNLQGLLKRRIGTQASRLAAAELTTRYPQDFAVLETQAVFPGLNEAITRAGSLTGGVSLLAAEKLEQSLILPAAGWDDAREKMLTALRSYGVIVKPAAELQHATLATALSNAALVLAPGNPAEAQEFLAVTAIAEAAKRAGIYGVLEKIASLPRVYLSITYEEVQWDAPHGAELIVTENASPRRLRLLYPEEFASHGDETAQSVSISGEAVTGARVESAPFGTVAQMQAVAAVREEAGAAETALLVGPTVWGGAIAAAVANLEPLVKRLRRKLMGIA